MKKIYLFLLACLCWNWLPAQEYIQIGFKTSAGIPQTKLLSDSSIRLNFNSLQLTKLFTSVKIEEFSPEFPSAAKFRGGKADTLKLVYGIYFKVQPTSSEITHLVDQVQSLRDSSLTGIYITQIPHNFYETNDYYGCFAPPDDCFFKTLNLIEARHAWDYTRGLPCIVVGVVEAEGAYFQDHVELDGQVVSGSGANYTVQPYWFTGAPNAHGREVAGVIAAKGNNHTGMVGLAYESKLRYYGANIRSVNGGFSYSLYNGILDAVNDDCKVINCSWGSYYEYPIPPSPYEQQVIDIAYYNNITVVGAAGNGHDIHNLAVNPYWYVYPASYDHVISVTSVGSQNPVGYFTGANWEDCHFKFQGNYDDIHQHNDLVDICAPGYWYEVLKQNNTYSPQGGTSLAAPHVSAAAALLYSLNPDFTSAEVEDYLLSTAHNIDHVCDNSVFAGLLGSGRLDAGAALEAAKDRSCEPQLNQIYLYDIDYGYPIDPAHERFSNHISCEVQPRNRRLDVDWDFVWNGQEVIKHGKYVELTWGNSRGDDFQLNHTLEFCKGDLEIYVRQGSECCYSPYFKMIIRDFDGDCRYIRKGMKPNEKELINSTTFNIYPNPATDNITIKYPQNLKTSKLQYKLFNSLGNFIKSGNINSGQTISLTSLPSGIYYLQTNLGNKAFAKK